MATRLLIVHTGHAGEKIKSGIGYQAIEQVKQFCYLESMITEYN